MVVGPLFAYNSHFAYKFERNIAFISENLLYLQ